MRLRLEYFDQNESFAPLLPRMGSVERFVQSRDSRRWVLLRFDEALEYKNCNYARCLLQSRWKGYEIAGEEMTSVFILLVGDEQDVSEGFEVKDFYHVAWGMIPANGSGK